MSKARTLANFVSSGNPLADGAIAASEVTGLSTVATTGAYNDLSGKPTLGTAAAQNTTTFLQTANNLSDVTAATARTNLGLATVAATGSYDDLSNKPTITTTATNIAGGSNGTIPYQSAAGTTQMLAVGSSGQLLQSNGAAAPTWVTPSAGALTLLSTVTATNVSTADIENTFSSTYDSYLLVGSGIYADEDLIVRLKIGGTYQTGTSYYGHRSSTNSTTTLYSAVLTDGLGFINFSNLDSNNTKPLSFNLYTSNPTLTGAQKSIFWQGVQNGSTITRNISGSAQYTTAGALTGIRFMATNLNGTFRLYGFSKT